MRRRIGRAPLAGLAALGFALAVAPAPEVSAAPLGCDVPEELSRVDARLPGLRARIAAGGPLTIVAIGDASTAGIKAGATDLAYPHWLQEGLARAWPSRPVVVVNQGVPHQSTEDMLARFARDVLAARPALVVWETGIVDAVEGIDLDAFAAALQQGIDKVHRHGVDIVLMDMQFSRKAATLIDFDGYLEAIHRVGDGNGIYVFPRYEMMRYWSQERMFDLDAVAAKEEASVAAAVYQCIGRRLAAAIVAATQ
jgi:acyl-CoA thioesterase I